jgi:hypothetical protein
MMGLLSQAADDGAVTRATGMMLLRGGGGTLVQMDIRTN